MVYYFKAYADLVKWGKCRMGDLVDFVVPTGNFGDILAGYFAKYMGLPVGRLVCASNANDVLTDFIATGEYDRNRPFYKTVSPSMDILVSSNLERLLFLMSGCDAPYVADLMAQLKATGKYQVSNEMLAKLHEEFWGGCCNDEGTAKSIGEVWEKYHYLCDTHTAVAWNVADKYMAETPNGRPVVVLSPASAYKFPVAVLTALGIEPEGDEFEIMEQLNRVTGVPVPKNLSGLREKEVLHRNVIEKDEILSFVLDKISQPKWN